MNAPKINHEQNKPLVIKLGGVILDTPNALELLFEQIAAFRALQCHQSNQKQLPYRPILIVHGGGCIVDEWMARLNLQVKKLNGLRVTPKDEIEFVVGALAGSANKTLVAKAVSKSLPAVGISIADGNITRVTKISEELGNVGEAQAGDPALLTQLFNANFLPIISSIGVTANGDLMNVNADQAAVAVAKSLNADLALLADVSGVLDAEKKLIAELDRALADKLIANKVITDGMIVKVNAALDAAKELGAPVAIASWKNADKLAELFAGQTIGTIMRS